MGAASRNDHPIFSSCNCFCGVNYYLYGANLKDTNWTELKNDYVKSYKSHSSNGDSNCACACSLRLTINRNKPITTYYHETKATDWVSTSTYNFDGPVLKNSQYNYSYDLFACIMQCYVQCNNAAGDDNDNKSHTCCYRYYNNKGFETGNDTYSQYLKTPQFSNKIILPKDMGVKFYSSGWSIEYSYDSDESALLSAAQSYGKITALNKLKTYLKKTKTSEIIKPIVI